MALAIDILQSFAAGDRSKHCRSVTHWPTRNQSYNPEIVRSVMTVALGGNRRSDSRQVYINTIRYLRVSGTLIIANQDYCCRPVYSHTYEHWKYSGTSPYGHLTSKKTSELHSPWLSPKLYSTVQIAPM